jgi:hypothetical protein
MPIRHHRPKEEVSSRYIGIWVVIDVENKAVTTIGVVVISVALLIIISTLAIGKLREHIKLILSATMLFGVIGFGLLFFERLIEVSLPGGISLKTVVQKTVDDARLVNEIKDAVLAQSNTIGLVSQKSNELSTKINGFELFIKKSEEEVELAIEAVTKKLSDTQRKLDDAERELKDIRERQQALRPRKLSEGQRVQLMKILNQGPKGLVEVSTSMGDGEASGFATELNDIFRATGWTTEFKHSIFKGRQEGIQLVVHNSNSIPPHAYVLVHAFNVINIPAQTSNNQDVPDGSVRLIVGHKP